VDELFGSSARRKLINEQKQAIRGLARRPDSDLGAALAELTEAGFSYNMAVDWPVRLNILKVKLDIFPPAPRKA
jgi:hypothetical protein